MIGIRDSSCPLCGGDLRYYDTVSRILRTKHRRTEWLDIRRMKCNVCGRLHRELPDNIYIYKQYEADIIDGVLEGLITSDTLGFEDYPCEQTMLNWINTRK